LGEVAEAAAMVAQQVQEAQRQLLLRIPAEFMQRVEACAFRAD